MTALPRGNAPEVLVGRVAVARTGRGPFRGRFERDCVIVRHVGMALEYLWVGWSWRGPVEVRLEVGLREIVGLFGTWGCHWSTCGQGGRGEGMIDDGFGTPGWH